ncbi:class I SAM-dependent methyltransferase [Pseudoalteromonas sp. MM17-2]|uniref:class I SAM-dependent DNA methyltransferase n=1 Tax=Pseudoalteromonas sp. MM17-2 TaxID=2917753 RepID=UPI001EF4569E|nr:class I SAM-dependent methyltransferase [Pseudoalteromonas sp. MM17-2]MCG7545770.1 class I SAM-dependent methyltransferase [Pseudoalteromonas sp. MM17-2]
MSESWDDYADGWDSNEAVILYCQKAHESLLNNVDLEGRKVLDFGCGTGLLTERISNQASSVVAIDPSKKMISVLKGKHLNNVHAINSELTQELIDNDQVLRSGFDIIVASSALAFVSDYQETLKLLKLLLRKGGFLVQWDWLKEREEPGIGFSEELIELALEQAGFSKYSTSVPFSLEGSDGSMKVVMGIAENA